MTFNLNVRGSVPYVPPTPAPTLASLIGYWPATVNMLNWSGSDGKTLYGGFSDFSPSNVNPLDGTKYWTTTGGPVGTDGNNASIAPGNIRSYDSTTGTVQRLIEDNTNNPHAVAYNRLLGDNTPFHPVPYRLLVVAKAKERTRIVSGIKASPLSSNANWVNATASVGFDLFGGNTGYDVATGTYLTVTGQQMINLGGGFWGCIFDFMFNTANSGTGVSGTAWFWYPQIQLDNGSGTAARSTTYPGDGSSGCYIAFCSLLPKALWNARSRVYFNDFPNLNSIDLNNTKNPGFDFYTNNTFPNSTPAAPHGGSSGFWGNPSPKPVTQPNVFSMFRPSVMKMQVPSYPGNNDNENASLISVVDLGSGSGLARLRGNYWAPPVIFDGYIGLDTQAIHALGNNLTSNTAFWSASAETLAGPPALDGSGHYLEYDFDDSSQSNSQSGWIYWDNTGTFINDGGLGLALDQPPTVNFPALRRITAVWIDSTSGGSGAAGWGILMNFVDGIGEQRNGGINVYQSGGVVHPQGGAAPTPIDSQHLAMFLWGTSTISAGPFPAPASLWDWVAVWQ